MKRFTVSLARGRVRVFFAVLLIGPVIFAPKAVADEDCDPRHIFAVDARSGHLMEMPFCSATGEFGPKTDVDAGDWRPYSHVFAVDAGPATLVYATTPAGELWWRRQERAGTVLKAPVRVGVSINWAQSVVFASAPGYLHIGEYGRSLRTYRQPDWASGGEPMSETDSLFDTFRGPLVTGLTARGFATGFWNGTNYRLWRDPLYGYQDIWYPSGRVPFGVSGVVGDGYWLFGVHPSGEIMLMAQPPDGPTSPPQCLLFDTNNWRVHRVVPGTFGRVIVPVAADGGTAVPAVAPPPARTSTPVRLCAPVQLSLPWEWQ
ncbi:MAG TPA: hypothetical protein VFV67_03380 [Actinophytocola sp.]|uniref:hypothetical protein n=1 Tax=Actinophytocola sp. TaxID=1872138 RepID=UPI002DB8DA7D|nr:hypothetical protein [Actinophytocola sp.]HEU5469669.1 hypothetical protein [Actinophytocola sp.]